MTKYDFTILVDSREREPYTFKKYDYKVSEMGLSTGDYSLRVLNYEAEDGANIVMDYDDNIAIERKTLGDFTQTITQGRERFEQELVRGQKMDFFAVVIEADCRNLYSKRLYSKINRGVIFHTATKWMVKYNIPFIWASTRGKGEKTVVSLLEAYYKYEILGEK